MGSYLRGTGTAVDPHVVHDIVAFKQMIYDIAAGKHFSVVADIDGGGTTVSIGSAPTASATINLNGHMVKNIKISSPYNYLFFNLNKLTIKNGSWLVSILGDTLANSVQSFEFEDLVIDFGKTQSAAVSSSNGIMTRCLFLRRWTTGSITGCAITNVYSEGVMSGCVNIASDRYNPNSYPGLKSHPDVWVLDGVSYPTTIKNGRTDLTTGYAIKGVTRVGNSRKSRNVAILSGAYMKPIWEGKSDDKGEYFAPLYDYYDTVIPLIFDDYGYPLKKDTNYVIDDVIHPSSPNGYRYICEQAGTSGPILPAEPWSVEVLLTAGTAKFRPYPVYEPKCLGPIYPGKANLITGEKV
jgi:hypothetical protein